MKSVWKAFVRHDRSEREAALVFDDRDEADKAAHFALCAIATLNGNYTVAWSRALLAGVVVHTGRTIDGHRSESVVATAHVARGVLAEEAAEEAARV